MNSLLSTAPALGQAAKPVHLCGKIWPQMSPIKCTLLWNVTLSRLLFPLLLNLCWSRESLWPMKGGRSNITWFPRLGLKRPCHFYLPSLAEKNSSNAKKKSRMSGHMERGPVITASPAPSQPSNECSCMKGHRQDLQQNCQPVHRIRINNKSLL